MPSQTTFGALLLRRVDVDAAAPDDATTVGLELGNRLDGESAEGRLAAGPAPTQPAVEPLPLQVVAQPVRQPLPEIVGPLA